MASVTRKTLEINVKLIEDAKLKKLQGELGKVKKDEKGIMTIRQKTLKVAEMQQKMDDRRFQAAHGFRMEMLSIMFGMQMLSRSMRTFLKSAVETYNKATNSQGQFTKQTMKLNAAWTFLKFRLIDALGNSDLFQSVIDFIVTLVDSIAGMDDDKMEAISIALVAITIAITAAAFLASWTLLMDGLKLFSANEGSIVTVSNALSKIAGLAAISLIISGWQDISEGELTDGLLKIMAGLSWWIPGVVGGVLGAIAAPLLISGIDFGAGLTLDNVIKAVGAGLGVSAAFGYSPALGIFTLSVALLITGIKFARTKTAQAGVAGISEIGKQVAAGAGLDEEEFGIFSTIAKVFTPLTGVGPTLEALGLSIGDIATNTGTLSENTGSANIETGKLKDNLLKYNETVPLVTDSLAPLTSAIDINEAAVINLDGSVFDLNDSTLEFTENTLLEGEAHLITAEHINVEIAALYRLRDAINAVNSARNSRYRTRSSS
jgi:hypothetical protein